MNKTIIRAFLVGLVSAGLHLQTETLACTADPAKPTVSVSGAQEGDVANYYVVEIPETGKTTVTITGSGDTPCPTDDEKCVCNGQKKDPETDGDPIYTFAKDAGTQDPANGPTIKWDVSSSTTPGEFKFKVTKIEQKYKACPKGWTGGVTSKSNTKASDEVTILAYKIETETVATSPTDRKRKKLGVGEEVTLKFLPATVSPDWTVENAKGSVNPANGATTTYTAHAEAATANVKAAFKGVNKTTTFNVVEPSGVKMEASVDLSAKNPLKAGFRADVYYLPADVNFEKIKVYEGVCTAVTAGYFDVPPYKGIQHAKGAATAMAGHTQGKGTKDSAPDTVTTTALVAPYTNGTFQWPIPWYYTLGTVDKQFTTVNHDADLTVDAAGKGTLKTSKAGESKQETNP